jgi:hypothetical protein
MKTRRLTKKLATAFRAYYEDRRNHPDTWNKTACLVAIRKSLPRPVRYFEATAGTFWLKWSDGKTTVHSEHNWWTCKDWEKNKTP